MLRAVLATLIFCALVTGAEARRHHHRPFHLAHRPGASAGLTASQDRVHASCAACVTIETAAGISITVAARLADRFKALIADFVAAGYHPDRIHCFAAGHHVPNSRHYVGAACDFDQRGWGKTARFMYSAEAHRLIEAHGLRDGRAFGDQGHVDDGEMIARHHRQRWARS